MNQSLRQRLPQQRCFKAPLPYIDPGSDSPSQLHWEERISQHRGAMHQLPGSGQPVANPLSASGEKEKGFQLGNCPAHLHTGFKGICVLQE